LFIQAQYQYLTFCLTRITTDSVPLITRSIAKNGLSPKPIIVSKDGQDRWVVRDGNRRMTALKLLVNPAEAPDEFRRTFQEMKKNAVPGKILDEIDCLTADEATIIEYRKLEHMGPQDGIGQVDWDARAKGNLRLDMEGKLTYPLARVICEFLEKKGVSEAGKVSITSMQRLFQDPEVSRTIGYHWDGERLYLTAKEDEVITVLKEIVLDFTRKDRNKRKKVADIYNPDERRGYLNGLLTTRGIKEPTRLPNPVLVSGNQPSDKKTPNLKGTIPTKTQPSWDRTRVIRRGMGLPIPTSEAKLNDILVELSSKIKVREATIAAAVLVRLVLERSVDYYIQKKKVSCKNDKLHIRISETAKSMEQAGKINHKEIQFLEKMSKSDTLFSAHTLNAWVHNSKYTPSPREVCTFWDNIYFFIVECWK